MRDYRPEERSIARATVAEHLARGCHLCKCRLTTETALVVVCQYELAGQSGKLYHVPALLCRPCYRANVPPGRRGNPPGEPPAGPAETAPAEAAGEATEGPAGRFNHPTGPSNRPANVR